MSPSYASYLARFYGLLRPQFVALDPSLSSAAEKDFEYCSNYFRGVGVRFLTVILPELRKAVDRSFETGRLEVPNTFRKRAGTQLPVFLYSHFEKVYEADGTFLPRPYIKRIAHIRQVLEAFYKIQIPYERSVENATLDNFVNNEIRIRMFLNDAPALYGSAKEQSLVTHAAVLCRRVFRGFDHKDIIPRNGPGKLATGEIGDAKWIPTTRYDAIDRVYPAWKYIFHSVNMLDSLRDEYKALDRLPHGTSKVKLVPKDSRGPRIITMEPHGYMWIQQGLRARLYDWLQNRCTLTSGHINFDDQSVNQYLALSSSLSQEWATLDLKDASDLLSAELVRRIFRFQKPMLRGLFAARTHETLLPNGERFPLAKFAGMGSATTFAVEAFCFWAIAVSCIAIELGISLQEATAFVYVYGDDIIVPTDLAEDVMTALESTGLIVNRAKSYYKGRFRESCGVDAYLSIDVTPLRFKKLFPVSLDDGESFDAWCAYANAFMRKGYTELANSIFTDLEKIFGSIPYGVQTSSFPCRIVDDALDAEARNRELKIKRRYSDELQRLEFKVFTLVPKDRPTALDGWYRLNRNLLSGSGDKPSRVVHPGEVKLVRRWAGI